MNFAIILWKFLLDYGVLIDWTTIRAKVDQRTSARTKLALGSLAANRADG